MSRDASEPGTPKPSRQVLQFFSRNAWTIAFVVTPLLALLGGALSVGAFTWNHEIPFEYAHDSFMVTVPVKTMIEHGWWYENDKLGAPAQMEFYDYPSSPNLHIAFLKCMSLFCSDAFTLLNLYFLLSFPLITLFSLFAFRVIRLAPFPSSALSIVFAFAPYHFWRGMAHLWLGCYLTVPLAMILVVWVLQNRSSFIGSVKDGSWKWTLFSLPTLAALVICAALGFDFPYYPVFTAFLLLIAGPYAAVQAKSWTPVIRSGILIMGIVFFFAANVSPNLVYRLQYGKNPSPVMVSTRSWTDSERYALKITSLVLPAEKHPIAAFKKLRERYNAGTITASEDGSPALGMIATSGFLFLIGWLLWRQNLGKTETSRMIDWMSLLTVATLLLATVGGFSALSSILVTGVLRGYNRISIFIMFFSLVPVGIWLGYLQNRCWDQALWRNGFIVGLLSLTLLGSFEQSRYFRKAGAIEIAEFQSDRNFVRQIEQDAGPAGKVFQYPLQNFLSYVGPAIAIDPYTHFRGYLHSNTLTWSFGAVVGRQGSDMQDWIASLEPEEALPVLTLLDFNGIYIDRKLYADHGIEIESEFARLLEAEPLVSEDQRLTYFSLKEYADQFHLTHSLEQIATLKRDMYPIVVGWKGFDAEEQNENETWRWCRKKHATLNLNNMGSIDRFVELKFDLATALPQSAECRIRSDAWEESLPLGAVAAHFSKKITVPPGVTSIHFDSTAEPFMHPARDVNFRIINLSYEIVNELDLADADRPDAP